MHHQSPQQQGGQVQHPQQQGGQVQQQFAQGGQQMGQRLQDVESPQQQTAIHDITWAIEVCEWCANQCIQLEDPNMAECIRLCEDVSELGETAITLIPRKSRFAHQHLQVLQQALQACAQECSQHHHAHCQECAEVLPQTIQSIQQFESMQQGSHQQMGGFQ